MNTGTANSAMYDFSTTEAAQSSGYLTPGYYNLSISEVELVVPDNGGTPRLGVTFSTNDGAKMTDKFFITPKALSRLQYLHEELFGKKCDKAFNNVDELGAYFKRALTGKKVERTYLVGGNKAPDGKVYASLGYTGFIMPKDFNGQMGAFNEDSALYKNNIKESTNSGRVATDDVMLPGSTSSSSKQDDDDMGLPF